MAHGRCMLDNKGYRCILRICNTNCVSTATLVTRTSLNVTLYVGPVLPVLLTYFKARVEIICLLPYIFQMCFIFFAILHACLALKFVCAM
jgi:hypothetical protein